VEFVRLARSSVDNDSVKHRQGFTVSCLKNSKYINCVLWPYKDCQSNARLMRLLLKDYQYDMKRTKTFYQLAVSTESVSTMSSCSQSKVMYRLLGVAT
jgi:hypothetical protein